MTTTASEKRAFGTCAGSRRFTRTSIDRAEIPELWVATQKLVSIIFLVGRGKVFKCKNIYVCTL